MIPNVKVRDQLTLHGQQRCLLQISLQTCYTRHNNTKTHKKTCRTITDRAIAMVPTTLQNTFSLTFP